MPSDIFQAPEPQHYRTKTAICRSKNNSGDRCVLYVDHYGKHKSKHLASEWDDAEAEESA